VLPAPENISKSVRIWSPPLLRFYTLTIAQDRTSVNQKIIL